MSVDIYFDTDGSAQDPVTAIQILSQSVAGYVVRHAFTDMWAGMQLPRRASLEGTQAILMMGTTAELQADLLAAYNQGVQDIDVVPDVLCIYFVRRKAGLETKTVVSIAPLDYWRLPSYVEHINQTWYRLWDGTIQNIDLRSLANTVLPRGKGVNSWY
jgi:hypothetical protein